MDTQQQKADSIGLDREWAKRGMRHFVRRAWPEVEPGRQYMHNWHIDAICEHLEAVARKQILRLVINIPPGGMKSRLCCVMFPAWVWTQDPTRRGTFLSYAATLALRDSKDTRYLVQSDWYQERWGADALDDPNYQLVVPDRAEWGKQKFSNLATGNRFCTSVGGTLTGTHSDHYFVDDPCKPDEVSKVIMASIEDWFRSTYTPRLVKGTTSTIIMQRLHEADPAGLALNMGYESLILPMSHEPSRVRSHTSLGFTDPRSEPDELLWPDRWDQESVDENAEGLGPIAAAAQLQQDPTPQDGAIFKREYIRYYTHPPNLRGMTLIQSWDCSFKGTETSDYVVGQIWGKRGADSYLLAQIRARLDFHASLGAIEQLSAAWPQARRYLVEQAANGYAIIQTLKKEGYAVVEGIPKMDKEARAQAILPQWASGTVHLPADAPWTGDFVAELLRFPRGANDDQVDAMTQALHYLHLRNLDAYKKAFGTR